MRSSRNWQVLLVGGASGVGKTSISYRLARHYRVGITEVDDFQAILEGMTDARQYPALHFWRAHYQEAQAMAEAEKLEVFIRYAETMAKALRLVIANHIESGAPIVLDGDFILPSLAVEESFGDVMNDGAVRAVFLYEESEAQIGRNYRHREGSEQKSRSRLSWLVSEWLRGEAERVGVPAVRSRPWGTTYQRAIAAIDAAR